jgi:hypothetical protein
MGIFDKAAQNKIKSKEETATTITKEDILKDIEEYRNLLPDDIYEAIKDNPELMAEIIMLLLKKKGDEEGKDARTLYRERQKSQGRSI